MPEACEWSKGPYPGVLLLYMQVACHPDPPDQGDNYEGGELAVNSFCSVPALVSCELPCC